MSTTMRGFLAVLFLGTGLFASGCQSAGSSRGESAVGTGEAVTCSKCKVTWVQRPVANQKGAITSYTTSKSMECPDCKTAVANFFETGKLKHSCATCGENVLEACKAH